MVSLVKKSLDVKMAGSLFVIVSFAFLVFIVSFSYFQEKTAGRLVNQVILQMEKADSQESAKQALASIPEALGQGTRWPAMGTALACLVFVMAMVGGVFNLFFFRPLKSLSRHLEETVKGEERDLTIRLALERADEVGMLSNRFDLFIANLNDIISSIAGKTETIAASSSQVFVASEEIDEQSSDLHARSNSVAAAAEEMNASMHTVAAASEQASTNIAMVAEAAGQMQANISGVAQNCDKARRISTNAMTQVEQASGKVGNLGEAAKEISNVTQVITEIAEQTNLLALNATIEAARAGEAGKGFAVVAGEIKSLASQTADATQNIREKIEGIQSSTQETVDEVGNISRVISEVDEIVNGIVLAIEDQSATATEVATNIEQASIGIAEVNENVAQSSQVASEIAVDISQVDGIAGDMSDQAGNMTQGAKDLDTLSMDLRNMIAVFRVSRQAADESAPAPARDTQIPDLIRWSGKLETAIPEIDDQHRELVRLVNLLHRAMRLQKGTGEVGNILKKLTEYTVFHFGFEEELFDRYDYPAGPGHKQHHEKLVAQVGAFQSDFVSGKATVTMELMDFLTDWLKNHILKTDMAYAPFLKEKMG